MTTMPTELIIPYTPHPGQLQFHKSQARFRILCCGRRWGKDRASIQEAIKRMVYMYQERRSLIPRVHVWFVGPSFAQLRQTWNELKAFIPSDWIVRKNEADMTIELFATDGKGVFIELKSADRPDDLVGTGLDILVITEAGKIKEEAWTTSLRGCLSSPQRGPYGTGGILIVNGTPKGQTWFYRLWVQGQRYIRRDGILVPNPQYVKGYQSWRFPSASNPLFDPKEAEDARRDMPANVFAQEYEAQFLEDAAGVFMNVSACASGMLEPPISGRRYSMGVDIAHLVDFTVITVNDVARNHVVYWDRLRTTDIEEQTAAIVKAARLYNKAPMYIDTTGAGQAYPTYVKRQLGSGYRVEGYYFTQDMKEQLVQKLQLELQRKTISYPSQLEILRQELAQYEYTYSKKSGRFKYGAPRGEDYHDDAVVSLGLANMARELKLADVKQSSYAWN